MTRAAARTLATRRSGRSWSLSPDGRSAVKRDGYDLTLVDVSTGREQRLTTDGTRDRHYGTHLDWWTFRVEKRGGYALKPLVVWSPDSTQFVIEQVDETKVLKNHLIQTTEPRPRLHSFAFALPGDEHLPLSSLFVVGVADGRLTPVDLAPVPLAMEAQIGLSMVWWSQDSKRVELVVRGRFLRDAQLITVDPATGAATTVVDERDDTLVEPTENWGARPNAHALDGSRAIWFSRRDEYGHLWLVEGDKWSQLTSGPWVVRELVHVDNAAEAIYFTASGREPDRNPYHCYLYRVGFDGGEPELLTPQDADHQVMFSPSGQWFVDCYSSVTEPPVTSLSRSGGETVLELSVADVSRLPSSGWVEPIPFSALAADGETELYGVLYPPPEIDESAPVPLVDMIYPGPMIIVSNHRYGPSRGHCEALAALGFATFTVDTRGTPYRSRAFQAVSYGQLEFATLLADHVAVIEQLTERFPWIDGDRVGITGVSGGGYASVRAMLTHPEVYKVCVSSAGNHDNYRLVAGWAEPYLGPVGEDLGAWERQSNLPLAGNLEGKLLLSWGGLDNNVPDNASLALVQAFVEANKDVDLVVLPNQDHWGYFEDPYLKRRCWDYFVEHLRGEAPPEYEISPRSLPPIW